MFSTEGILKVSILFISVLLLAACCGVSSFSSTGNRDKVMTEDYLLNCKQHAYLYRSRKDYTTPPNKTCRKRYTGHLYYVAEIAGEPVVIEEISALVTGGPSELGEMVEGFKLEVLTPVGFRKSGRTGGWTPTKKSMKIIVGLFSQREVWTTLATFAAPCNLKKSTEVYWEGDPIKIIAVRIVAPEKHFVAFTKLGAKPDDGNEIKQSGGWMKIMNAPGHADYVKN